MTQCSRAIFANSWLEQKKSQHEHLDTQRVAISGWSAELLETQSLTVADPPLPRHQRLPGTDCSARSWRAVQQLIVQVSLNSNCRNASERVPACKRMFLAMARSERWRRRLLGDFPEGVNCSLRSCILRCGSCQSQHGCRAYRRLQSTQWLVNVLGLDFLILS